MKKVLLSMLLSAMLCVVVAPAAEAKAAEAQTGSFQLEVEEPVIEATVSEVNSMPTAEVNAATTVIVDKAVVVGEDAYVYVQFSKAGHVTEYYSSSLFDENGKKIEHTMTSTTKGDIITCRFKIDAFTGSKNITFVAYYNNGTDYTYMAAKKGVVTATSWQGSMDVSAVSALDTSNYVYTNVYLPKEVNAKTVEVYIYDGDVAVGYMDITGTSVNSYFYIDSLIPEIKNPISIYSQNDVRFNRVRGNIYFAKKLQGDKYYSVKAFEGDKIYDLGYIYARGDSYVEDAYYTTSYAGTKPVIQVTAYGYNMSDLVVQILDRKTRVPLATSVGGAILQTTDSCANYQLVTDKTLDELVGNLISVNYAGQEIFTGTFYKSFRVVNAYYNHVDNVVVAKTYGIPDGTTVTANLNDGKEYTAQGQVLNSTLVLQFMKDGVATKLPVGSYYITYTYSVDESKRNDSTYSMSVMGKDSEEVSATSIRSIATRYFDATKPLALDITVSPDVVEAQTGDFFAQLKVDGEQVGNDIPLTAGSTTVDDVLCWKLTANAPVVACGKYVLEIYRGIDPIVSYTIYVMDPTKVYAKLYSMSWTDGSCGVELYMPQTMDNYDKSLFGVTVTDIMGNDIGITTANRSGTSKYYNMYQFENVPEDVLSVNVSFTYNGQPVYDIDEIASNTLLWGTVEAQLLNSYYVTRSTMSNQVTGYTFTTAFNPNEPSYAYVVETGTMNVIKTWDLQVGRTYFAKDMLEGLNYDTAAMAYDVYFRAKDGTGYENWTEIYLGLKKEATIVANGIGTNANGNYVLYIDSQLATNYYGLYYWAERNQYVAVVGGYVDFTYNGLVELYGTWWYVKNGVVDFTYTGLTNANDGWWMVVGGAVDFTYNGLVEYGGAWWMVQNGAINFAYTGLAANEFGWWMVVGGEIDFNYNGLVANEFGWWMVQNGAINFAYTGLAANEFGWWAVVGGAIDFNYNGLMANEFGWWCVQNGTINFGYTGLAQNEAGWWYVENGAINFGYTGTAMGPDGNNYNVVNGAVVF